jgi:hypothetical protein
VSEDSFLLDWPGQGLDGGPRVLLLARINNCLRSELTQHPVHPAEFRRWHNESNLLSCQFGFDTEIAPMLGIVVANDVPHNTGTKIGKRDEPRTTVAQLLPPDHLRAPLLVSHATAIIKSRGRSLEHGGLLIRLVF